MCAELALHVCGMLRPEAAGIVEQPSTLRPLLGRCSCSSESVPSRMPSSLGLWRQVWAKQITLSHNVHIGGCKAKHVMEHLHDVLFLVSVLKPGLRTVFAVFTSSVWDSMACLPGPRMFDHTIAGSGKVCVMAAKPGVPQRVSCSSDVSQEEPAVQCSCSRCSSTRGSCKRQRRAQQNHRHRAALRSRAVLPGGVLLCTLGHQISKKLLVMICTYFKGIGAFSHQCAA